VTGDRPRVQLTWDLWCARHLAPYRAKWPAGAAVAMTRLFEAAVAMPAVADAAKRDAANLTGALRRFRPLCCFVGKHAMDRIYAETVPGRGD
jgi:hypothetical protein